MIDTWKRRRAYGCLAASLVAAPYLSVAQTSPAPQEPTVIYVARRGWHVDIGFAAADLQPPLRFLVNGFPGVQYLFFGFGDRRYLLAKKRNAPVLLAALWPGRAMILATGLTSPPPLAFGARDVVALSVTARQASDVQAFVWRSLGDPSPYAAGPYEGSLYFTATPRYSAFHTCNTWAAESLAAASLPIHSRGVIFAGQLWAQVRRLAREQGAQVQGGYNPTASMSPIQCCAPVSTGFTGARSTGTVSPWLEPLLVINDSRVAGRPRILQCDSTQ